MSNITIPPWAEYARPDLTPKYKARRFDDNAGNRFYFFRDDQGELQTASGITSWLKMVMPESSFLTDWKIKHGKEWMEVLNLSADYGTLMHKCFADILIHQRYPDEYTLAEGRELAKRLKKYSSTTPLNQLEKDIAAFLQFLRDYKVKPLLIEAVLICKAKTGDYYAMTADLPCELTYTQTVKEEYEDGVYQSGPRKGQPKIETRKVSKEVTEIACIDFKSNPFGKDEKGFFEAHKFQLIATGRAIYQNFGLTTAGFYNWSPNNWKKEPSYTFYRHEIKPEDKRTFDLYEELATIQGYFKPKGSIMVFNGLDSPELVTSYHYLDYVKKFFEKEV